MIAIFRKYKFKYLKWKYRKDINNSIQIYKNTLDEIVEVAEEISELTVNGIYLDFCADRFGIIESYNIYHDYETGISIRRNYLNSKIISDDEIRNKILKVFNR